MVAWLARTGAPTQAEVAREAEMHPMQVSLMLKALEAKGMLRRKTSSRRATAKEVELTEQGLDALSTALPLAIAVQRQMFGDAGEDGGELLTQLRRVEEKGLLTE